MSVFCTDGLLRILLDISRATTTYLEMTGNYSRFKEIWELRKSQRTVLVMEKQWMIWQFCLKMKFKYCSVNYKIGVCYIMPFISNVMERSGNSIPPGKWSSWIKDTHVSVTTLLCTCSSVFHVSCHRRSHSPRPLFGFSQPRQGCYSPSCPVRSVKFMKFDVERYCLRRH